VRGEVGSSAMRTAGGSTTELPQSLNPWVDWTPTIDCQPRLVPSYYCAWTIEKHWGQLPALTEGSASPLINGATGNDHTPMAHFELHRPERRCAA